MSVSAVAGKAASVSKAQTKMRGSVMAGSPTPSSFSCQQGSRFCHPTGEPIFAQFLRRRIDIAGLAIFSPSRDPTLTMRVSRVGEASMERRKASDFPQELLGLFDRYVHGVIGRRDFLDGAQTFAVGGITAAGLFQMLKPNYAWAI